MIRWLVAAVLAPVAIWAQLHIDRQAALRQQQDVLYLRSGADVRRLCPGFEGLMADVYWLRVVQYYGHERVFGTRHQYELLEPLVEITTTLDPRLVIAYRYGAIFLAEQQPVGAGRPDVAVGLLERGVRENPQNWQLRQDLGFVHFFFRKDAVRAAEVLDEAAGLPGAPIWLRSTAADFLSLSGHREVSRKLWRRLHEQGEEWMRSNAQFRLQRLDALDAIDRLDAEAARFRERTGRPPESPAALAALLGVRALPPDPAGVPFSYDSTQGHFEIAKESPLWRPRKMEGE